MDVVHDIIVEEEEEDRISNLPDDIIHRILSFLDMKYAIQTCALSKKWKHIWTSMPHLTLDSSMFYTLPQFAKFVKHLLSHRNHHSEVSAVELKYTGAATQFAVRSLVKYAYSHNVRQLNVMWCTKNVIEFPQYLFSSHTLKHLTLATTSGRPSSKPYIFGCCVSKSAWDFPALETLNLSNMQLCDTTARRLDLFSKCLNLKDLTLHEFDMTGLDIFNVCAPQLSNLTITDPKAIPKVFNVVAPQLENMTLSVNMWGSCLLQLSTEGFDSLEKVNLSMSWYCYNGKNKRYVTQLLDLFQKLRSAKLLILDMNIIEALSSFPDLLVHEPCPFSNLKCLKIDKRKDLIPTMPTQVRNYFLESSPSATIIMDLPQVTDRSQSPCRSRVKASFKVAQKRTREEVDKDTMANKVAKLEEEKQKQDEVIEQQKAMLEKLMSQMINWKMAELQVQVEGGNPDYKLIRSMGRDIKSIMESTPESLSVAVEAQFSRQYEEVKHLFLTRIDASQWAQIETELGCTSHFERINSDNVRIQPNVHIVALPPLPSGSSANMSTSSTQALSDQD